MAKHDYKIDEKKIARFIAEGRGQGTGKTYKPWLTIQDVPSDGRTHRPPGWKTGRVHQLLSDVEYHCYLILNWAEDVIDIREQFPLDRSKTLAIAKEMGVEHPRQPGVTNPMVMTTDFLVVSRGNDGRRLSPCTAKTAKDLRDARTVEKLEIERRYWATQSQRLYIFSDTALPMTLVNNLDWFYTARDLSDQNEPHKGYFEEMTVRVLGSLPRVNDTRPLTVYCNHLDETLAAEPGTALLIMKHLLALRRITTDLNQQDVRSVAINKLQRTPQANQRQARRAGTR